ncbi:MAG: DUF6702 family protein [Phycisphaerales bacterium]
MTAAAADRLRALGLLLAIGLALCAPSVAGAHPYHVAFLEAEANPETERLQVAMRIFPEDLERALERMSERRSVDLERAEDVDELITRYLARTVLLRDPDAAPDDAELAEPEASIIHWVGKELGVRHTWLYFEVDLGRPDAEGLEISVRSMFEVEPTQENTIRFRRGEERVTVRCNRREPWALVDFTPEPAPESPDDADRESR